MRREYIYDAQGILIETREVAGDTDAAHALASRIALKQALEEETLTGAELETVAVLYDEWGPDTDYAQDQVLRYDGHLYIVRMAHRSQADWTPDVAVTIFSRVAPRSEGTGYPVWQPWDGHNESLHQVGDIVHYPDADGPLYISEIPNNSYAPDEHGWALYEP